MKRTLIAQLSSHVGEKVMIAGFVQTIRNQGKIDFFILRDITGTVQAVVTEKNTEAFSMARTVTLESVVRLHGLVKAEKQAPTGFEVDVETIEILSLAEPQLPIPVIEKSDAEIDVSKRFDWRWLDLRKEERALIFKVWTAMEDAFRSFWVRNEYIEIHSPKLMGSPSESGSNVFEVKYFDRKAYLAQSPQFYKQMAMAAGFEKVFEVGPVFRAEPSFTTRHATEFTGYDAEFSYIESHEDVMREIQEMLRYVIATVQEKYGTEIERVFGRTVVVPDLPFPQFTMKEAKAILSELGVESEDEDLSPEEERRICAYVQEKHGHEFVFITEYPVSIRPFYHMRPQNKPEATKSFDLLWNGIEIVTGAQREHRYDVLLAQAKEKGLSQEGIQFYLNFFRYGCPPHGGFGLGASRVLMKLLDLQSVREGSFLFRGVNRLEP